MYWDLHADWRAFSIINFIDIFLLTASMKTSNSSNALNGEPIASQRDNNKHTVEKLFSPPDKPFVSFMLLSSSSSTALVVMSTLS
jgi:hypothetical protein